MNLEVHHSVEENPDLSLPDAHQDMFVRNFLGFWMYLMTDCLLFASLFVTYAVLHKETFGGPTSKEIFSLPLAFAETIMLLCSSVTCGFGILESVKNHKERVIIWLMAALFFALCFLIMEIKEFTHLVHLGHDWKKSAFLSAFFTLVGTHGLHVTIGSIWLIVVALQIGFRGITSFTFRRLVIFGMFWHFLDLVWIFIFTYVYLMGVIY